MKTKMLVLIFMTIVGTVSASPLNNSLSETIVTLKKSSPSNGELSFFRAHRQGKGVSVSWGVVSGEGIAGFILQRTYQDPGDPYAMWENISSMSCNGSRSYKCEEENVYPGFINYRVVTVMANGSRTTSFVSTIHIISRRG